ncbi:hypothetical protein V6Z11_D05G259000 [Gossypium hirsutum]
MDRRSNRKCTCFLISYTRVEICFVVRWCVKSECVYMMLT